MHCCTLLLVGPSHTLLLATHSRFHSAVCRTQEAKARATRTAMLIEYAYRHEYAKAGGKSDKYDLILSA
jgi:hypothetical protein